MNKLTIIGNLTRDPEMRTTSTGKNVCSFTVAVNRRQKDHNGQNLADFFRVNAWNELGESCHKYLAKGRKVAVVGPVSVSVYTNQSDGKTYANLEVMANEVEFLTPKGGEDATSKSEQMTQMADNVMSGQSPKVDQQSGFEQVEMNDDLPF